MSTLKRLWTLLALLPRVRILSVRPGDVLVLKTDRALSEEETHLAREILQREFPGHRGIILDDGAELEVVRAEEIVE
jgi:hypothetical protein